MYRKALHFFADDERILYLNLQIIVHEKTDKYAPHVCHEKNCATSKNYTSTTLFH